MLENYEKGYVKATHIYIKKKQREKKIAYT
jgi:hypothetical protein